MAIPVVIDACVALKWRFRDEHDVENAIDLLADALNGNIDLFAPILWIYEITNALRTAVMRKRLTEVEAMRDLKYFLQIDIQLILPRRDHLNTILSDAISCQCSVYDISYIDLAYQLNCEFYTGDLKLYHAICQTFSFIHWIGDYQSQSKKIR
jgi:predicted nucleic acid-binding protein